MAAAAVVLLACSAPAQYYPRSRQSYPQTGRQSGAAKEKNEDNLLATFTGPVKGVDKKSILLETEGGNDLQFHLNRKTEVWDGDKKLSPRDLKLGAWVQVEAKRFPDGSLDAVTVRLDPAAARKAAER